jgi:hypothetical protein
MLRFTTRELILLVVIVAVCAAWWADHSRIVRKSRAFEASASSWKRRAEAGEFFINKKGWTVIRKEDGGPGFLISEEGSVPVLPSPPTERPLPK